MEGIETGESHEGVTRTSGREEASMEPIITKHLRGSKSGQTNWFELGSNEELTIGRDPSNKLAFHQEEDDVVGRRHAKIVFQEGGFILVDLNSRNGTFVNNERISSPTPLKQGDVIDLGTGGPRIQFYSGKEPLSGHATKVFQISKPPMRPTRYVSPDNPLLVQLAKGTTADQPRTPSYSIVMKHLRGSKSGQMNWFDLKPDDDIAIGRDPLNKLIFHQEKDDLVGRRHAKVVNRAGTITVIDLNSRNGTFLNQERITGPSKLKSGDVIEFGAGGPQVQFYRTEDLNNGHFLSGAQKGGASGNAIAGSRGHVLPETAELPPPVAPEVVDRGLIVGAWAVIIFVGTVVALTILM